MAPARRHRDEHRKPKLTEVAQGHKALEALSCFSHKLSIFAVGR
jgi:hypothetical protein